MINTVQPPRKVRTAQIPVLSSTARKRHSNYFVHKEPKPPVDGAIDKFIHFRQNKNETETEITTRLNSEAYNFENVHEEREKTAVYVKVLLPTLSTIVSRF